MIKKIHDNDKYIYNHTVNTYNDYTSLRGIGIDGVYTDQLLPRVTQVYENLAEEVICINENREVKV